MIDTKSRLVLKILAKDASDGGYKVMEIADIIMALPKKYRMDSDAVKHILTHLERQDFISIKYDEDDVYCLAVLPYGFEVLENETSKNAKGRVKNSNALSFLIIFAAALLGTICGVVFCYFLLKLK